MWQRPPPNPLPRTQAHSQVAARPLLAQSGGVAWGLGDGGGSQERSTACPGVSGALEAARASLQELVCLWGGRGWAWEERSEAG